jgi:GNAT superfamily N-acetyltransferase
MTNLYTEEVLRVNINPSDKEMRQIKQFLLQEVTDHKEGFYFNWHLIKDAYADQRLFSFHMEDECVGFVDWRENTISVEIDRFVIKREYRKIGLGTIFISRLMTYWRERKKAAVTLYSEPKTSAGFWRCLKFIQFPISDRWTKLYFYKNLLPVKEVIKTTYSENKVELWDVDPIDVKDHIPKWTWRLEAAANPTFILQPCSSSWNVRITKDGEIAAEGKVGRVSDEGEQIYFYPFLYIRSDW